MEPCCCNEPKKKDCVQRAPFGITDVRDEEPRRCELFDREVANERLLSLLMKDADG